MGEALTGAGEGTGEEKEGGRYPPHVRSTPTIRRGCAYILGSDLGFRNLELNVKGYVKSTSGPSRLTV